MDRFSVTITVSTETLSGAVYLYQILHKELWDQGVDPEAITGHCITNGESLKQIGNHGQVLTIDDLAFGLDENAMGIPEGRIE